MRNHLMASLLVLGIAGPGHYFAGEPDAESLAADERTLRSASLGTDGPALLDFFRKHTLTDADGARIRLLIEQLGAKAFRVREKASAELLSLGPRAIALLRPALKDPDREVARRAEDCLRQLENGGKNTALAGPAQWTAAVRLLAVRKPDRAGDVLLGYLPFAGHEEVVEEIQTALVAVAVREGKPEPALTAALTAAEPLRRGIAGAALARAGVSSQKTAVRKLLQDPDPGVRLRIGLALAGTQDKAAVPVLIELLGQLPMEQGWPAEELLRQLAEAKAPAVSLGADAASRGKCRDAWAAWWRGHGAAFEMPALEGHRPHLGYTLIVIPDYGTVTELDRDGKARWQIGKLQSPFHAQVLPGNRVLVAEYSGRVSERNLKGDILWQVSAHQPMQCQRLANGNTFIVTTECVLEADAAGKEACRYGLGISLVAARKLRSGQIVVMDSNGVCRRLDSAGKEIHRFTVGKISNNCLEVLPNGNILVARMFDGKVTEYTAQGKALHEISCVSPFSAYRLPNGNTLVACYDPARVVELDRAGKVIRDHKAESLNHRPWFASRR